MQETRRISVDHAKSRTWFSVVRSQVFWFFTSRNERSDTHDFVLPIWTSFDTRPIEFAMWLTQAILNLETALITSAPPYTVSSTASVTRKGGAPLRITANAAASSWLRGFVAWIPSSEFSSERAGNGRAHEVINEAGLWVGTAELFGTALRMFLAEPGNQRSATILLHIRETV